MLAILVSLALLIVLTFRKINIVVVGIAAAAVMALLSGQPVVTAVTDTYMTGAAQFVRDNFLLFFFSVLFGKVMEETGAAASIAKFLAELLGEKFAILGVIFSGAVLVYGGVTTLVVVFSLYPIALSLFKKANLPSISTSTAPTEKSRWWLSTAPLSPNPYWRRSSSAMRRVRSPGLPPAERSA